MITGARSTPSGSHASLALGYRFPTLRESLLRRGVTGLYDFTPDGQPIVDGPIGIEGYYVATGFSGIGFKSAVRVARLVHVDIDGLHLRRGGGPLRTALSVSLSSSLRSP
jgi:glycine/D-amino acid oxidase-like deaminating enzyme